jgi:hypothetical protein
VVDLARGPARLSAGRDAIVRNTAMGATVWAFRSRQGLLALRPDPALAEEVSALAGALGLA